MISRKFWSCAMASLRAREAIAVLPALHRAAPARQVLNVPHEPRARPLVDVLVVFIVVSGELRRKVAARALGGAIVLARRRKLGGLRRAAELAVEGADAQVPQLGQSDEEGLEEESSALQKKRVNIIADYAKDVDKWNIQLISGYSADNRCYSAVIQQITAVIR